MCIDEQCIPFKGRHIARQYNGDKPQKWHFRVFSMNDCRTKYMLNFYMYKGKKEILPDGFTTTSNPSNQLTMSDKYRNKNYILYQDNWFTSFDVCENMLNRGIYAIGTVRSNRLAEIQHARIKEAENCPRGTIRCYKKVGYDIYFVSWKDASPVNMLTTIVPRITKMFRDVKKDGNRVEVYAPTTVKLYNKGKGGTDSFDQLLQYYWKSVRSIKWPFRVLHHFFMVAVINSHILFKMYHHLTREDEGFTLLSFMQMLIRETVCKYVHQPPEYDGPMKKTRAKNLRKNMSRLVGLHHPKFIRYTYTDKFTGQKRRKETRRMCVVCKKATPTACDQCGVGLHIRRGNRNKCWDRYHSLKF